MEMEGSASERAAMVDNDDMESPSTTMSGSGSGSESPTAASPPTPNSLPSLSTSVANHVPTVLSGAAVPVEMEMTVSSAAGGGGGGDGGGNGGDLSGKRGRGRPRGSGKRQMLATLGEWFALSAGGNFTPHVVTVATGEDVATRILSFSQKGPRSICILSANGSISNVTLRQPGSCGGTLTYEGRFEILSLSGSFTLSEDGSTRSRTGGLSISLAGPDGRVVGGGVAGLLLAASPIQVVVGSFVPNTVKAHKRRAAGNQELPAHTIETRPDLLANASVRPISQVAPNDNCDAVPVVQGHAGQGKISAIATESTNPVPFQMVGWPRQGFPLTEQRASPDINICLQHEQ